MFLKNTTKTNYFLQTQEGMLNIGIGPKGLNHIFFENCSPERIQEDAAFRDTFVNWLNEFQSLTNDKRWATLSPEGTDFQKTVWRALLDIPTGSTTSYGAIAQKIGRPKAFRAVGSAIGANPISLLIPCHRVVPATGGIGNYRWGSDRKQALLEAEKTGSADLAQLFKTT